MIAVPILTRTREESPEALLERLRRELPRAERELAEIEARLEGHEAVEAELSADDGAAYIGDCDPRDHERRRIEHERAKAVDHREHERLVRVVADLRGRISTAEDEIERGVRAQMRARIDELRRVEQQADLQLWRARSARIAAEEQLQGRVEGEPSREEVEWHGRQVAAGHRPPMNRRLAVLAEQRAEQLRSSADAEHAGFREWVEGGQSPYMPLRRGPREVIGP